MSKNVKMSDRFTMSPYERNLFERVSAWHGHDSLADLTAEALTRITEIEGVDFATALLYQRLVNSQSYGPAIARLNSMFTTTNDNQLDARVIVVPGAFYHEFAQSGADGKIVREEAAKFGCTTELLPLESFGSLSSNAAIICKRLIEGPDEPILLVSLSKGGAEVKLALASPNASHIFRNVVAWMDLSGLLQGTPLVPWIFSSRLRIWKYRTILRLRGFDFNHLPELAPGPTGLLNFDLRLPDHMCAIHVVGFPLARHMTNAMARRCHKRLKPLGPNDGGALLGDVCSLPGIVYPVWGADHYLRPHWGDARHIAIQVFHLLRAESVPRVRPEMTSGAVR